MKKGIYLTLLVVMILLVQTCNNKINANMENTDNKSINKTKESQKDKSDIKNDF